jgi:hypothetical protein
MVVKIDENVAVVLGCRCPILGQETGVNRPPASKLPSFKLQAYLLFDPPWLGIIHSSYAVDGGSSVFHGEAQEIVDDSADDGFVPVFTGTVLKEVCRAHNNNHTDAAAITHSNHWIRFFARRNDSHQSISMSSIIRCVTSLCAVACHSRRSMKGGSSGGGRSNRALIPRNLVLCCVVSSVFALQIIDSATKQHYYRRI